MELPEQMRAFEEILDPLSYSRTVDLKYVRNICSRGIPDQPPWIRPRIWKLLLGTLPPQKELWPTESRKARDRYYDLATEFLDEVERMPPPTIPLAPKDKLLDTIAKDVDRTQPRVPFFRSFIDPSPLTPLSPLPYGYVPPLTDAADEDHIPPRIDSASALFERLTMIQESLRPHKSNNGASQTPSAADTKLDPPKTPEIRLSSSSVDGLEFKDDLPAASESRKSSLGLDLPSDVPRAVTPILSVTSPTSPSSGVELLSSKPLPKPLPRHQQVLLRILYLFSVTHPHQPYTQGLNELLAPLYLALCMDLDEREAAHAEADAFWLFSELYAEVGAVVGEPGDWRNPAAAVDDPLVVSVPGGAGAASNGVKGAMAEFSNRLKWADLQLWEDLARKSLDPGLPYYSYRWIACLLAQDLPIGDVLRVWDTIFSQSPSTPDANPRISFLINLCTSMLIRLRYRLIKTGGLRQDPSGLWADEYIDADEVLKAKTGRPPPTSEAGVMGEGFVEGMQILQAYPIQQIGLDMVIHGAWELSERMNAQEELQARGPSTIAVYGGAIRDRIWKGITNQGVLEEEDESGSESETEGEGQATEKEDGSAVRAVSKAAAEDTPSLPAASVLPLPSATALRQYAEGLRDSDAAARLNKTTTNWRVALDTWRNPASNPTSSAGTPAVPPKDLPASPTLSASSPLSPTATQTRFVVPSAAKLMENIKSSDTAASLSKVSTNWTAAALDRWNKPASASPTSPPASAESESSRSRGGSLGSWTSWGSAILGANKSQARGPDTLSPSWVPDERDNRTSLPVPLHRHERSASASGASSPMRPSSATRSRLGPAAASPDASPPPTLRPPKFANPRDSWGGFPERPGDDPDPLQLALARIQTKGDSPTDSSPEDTTSKISKSIQSALATLSGGNQKPPSPPPSMPKYSPRPLLLGTAAAKVVTVPTPNASPTPKTRDIRDRERDRSSISSTTSTMSVTSGSSAIRSITPTPRSSQASQATSVATSIRPESPKQPSDGDSKRPLSSIITLKNGVGRPGGASTVLMRKSRAAYTLQQKAATEDFGGSDLPQALSPTSTDTYSPVDSPRSIEAAFTPVKKYALTDGPAPPLPSNPPSNADAGYSSASSVGAVQPILRDRQPRLRAKRNYQPRTNPLRVVTTTEPDEFGLVPPKENGVGDENSLRPESQLSDVTATGEGLKTPTSEKDSRSPRSPRSPRRRKSSNDREARVKSVALSEEEGDRADDEDDYGGLLSAYSEDDTEGKRRTGVAM